MRPPGSPRKGFLAGSNTREPRGSAPRERDHRGGDHPVPSRTRQLSPPSPRVLQRQAAGGQGVALAEGAFLFARAAAEAGRARGGIRSPRGPFLRFRASMRGACSAFQGRLLLRAGPFLVQGAHALSAALCIDKVRRRNAICGRRRNAKREAVDRRASWQAANLRVSRRWAAASLLVSLWRTLLRVFFSFVRQVWSILYFPDSLIDR